MLSASHAALDRDLVHRRCLAARSQKAGAEWEVCFALLDALRSGVWQSFGMTGVAEYADRYLGLPPKATYERIRVARELEQLPALSNALREGILSWSVVREVTRVARPGKEELWLERVLGLSMREVEALVADRNPGDGPDDPPSLRARRHRVSLDLTADQYALLREAIGAIKKDAGEPLSDEAAIAVMARQALAGPGDEGRAPYQILVTVCEACGRGTQAARGREVAVAPEVIERALCDAQVVGQDGPASQAIPPATRRQVMRRDRGACRVPGCRLAGWVDVHHIQLRSEGGDHDPSNLLVVCAGHHAAVHEGRLVIERDGDEVRFLCADGSAYGQAASPSTPQLFADVFSALKNMGCPEGIARRAIDLTRPHVGPGESVEEILRRCLSALRAV